MPTPTNTPSSPIVPFHHIHLAIHTVTQEDADQENDVDNKDDEALCMICLDPLHTPTNTQNAQDTTPSSPIVHSILLDCSCSHQAIHPKCLQRWYTQYRSCPICRQRESQSQSFPLGQYEYSPPPASPASPPTYHFEVSKMCLTATVFFLLMVCIVFIIVGRYYWLMMTDTNEPSEERGSMENGRFGTDGSLGRSE